MTPLRRPGGRPRRGIYLLPNLLTSVGLFAGFYAIVVAARGDFAAASIAVFVSIITDGLDGRIARMTNSQSDFGAEYDSLADMVAFGVAPALVMYHWALADLGKPGWLFAFLYTAGAALRLARFNVQGSATSKAYFQGLPSPSAAGLMVTLVWLGHSYALAADLRAVAAVMITMLAAALMVSALRYHSFKEIDLRQTVPFMVIVLIVLGLAVLFTDPPLVLFGGFLLYTVSGPVVTLHLIRERRRRRQRG